MSAKGVAMDGQLSNRSLEAKNSTMLFEKSKKDYEALY